jgi:hypothetical protein
MQCGKTLNTKDKEIFFIYSYVHTLFGLFIPPAPAPFLSPPHPLLPGRTCTTFFSNFVEEKT